MIWGTQTRAYVDVGAGVGVSVGEGVGVDVGAGVGVDVGAGVGLHAQTACSMLPLTCAHHSASRSADRPQSARGCAPVSVPSQRGPGAGVNSSVTLCERAHDCVRGHVHASSCMPVRVSPQRAWYGACKHARTWTSAQAWACRSEQEWASTSAQEWACMRKQLGSTLPLTCAHHSASRSAHRPQSRRGNVHQRRRRPSAVPAQM